MLFNSLLGQYAFITGGSKGIGFQISQELASRGCRITIIARSALQCQRSVEYLNKKYPIPKQKHNFLNYDLLKTSEVCMRIAKVYPEYKNANILVNCAGMTQKSLLLNTREQDIVNIYTLNLIAPAILSRFFARSMIRQKHKNANILNISSMLAERYLPGTTAYSSSKMGLVRLTTTMSKEFMRHDNQLIRVNAILPGLIKDTDMGNAVNFTKMKEYGLGDMITDKESVARVSAQLILDGYSTGEVVSVLNK